MKIYERFKSVQHAVTKDKGISCYNRPDACMYVYIINSKHYRQYEE
jgi:hypothetical protein